MDELKRPCGCIVFTSFWLAGVILTTIGLLGMFRGWGPIDLFTVIFTLGVVCAGMSIIASISIVVAYCFS
jgi:hypothetical protein